MTIRRITAARPAWMLEAPCRALPTEVFFPSNRDHHGYAMAKAVCSTCPFKSRCLRYAIDNREEGVWGATTEYERKLMQGKGKKSRLQGRVA